MSDSSDIWSSTAISESSISASSDKAIVLNLRENILKLTQATEDAVLRPKDYGAWPCDLRSALAARISKLNGLGSLAQKYALAAQGSDYFAACDPNHGGEEVGLGEVLKFVDQVSLCPRDIEARDIQILQDADIADADIVRLCQLTAFMAYQVRLVAGLQMLNGIQS